MPPSVRREAPFPAPRAQRIEFDRFELDLRSRELRKSGRRIRLQAQPFQLLTMLLEHAGEVVTREEACRNLWTNDTFVDFDHSLAEAISKIREALGDCAENPKYIETLPKLGYRFIGKITPEPPVVMPVPDAQDRIELQPVSAPAPAENGDCTRTETVGKSHRFTRRVASGVALAAVAIAVSAPWFFSKRPHSLTAKDTIVLADFANATGDPVFDGALRQGLSVQLEQSPFLSIVSSDQIHETLERMGRKPDARLTPELAREVCQRTSSAVVLDGTIAEIGSRYQLTLRASSCMDGKSIASDEVLAKDKDNVLDALSTASSDIRKKLGESLDSIQKYDAPLAQVTTSSLDALRALSLSVPRPMDSGLPFLKHAVELDPHFAFAYVQLSAVYDALGESELASEYAQKAFDNRAQASELELLLITEMYYYATLGDIDRELSVYPVWQQTYPREAAPWVDSSATHNSLGDYERALQEAQQAIRLAPNAYTPYSNACTALLGLNRREEAEQLARQALGRGLDAPALHLLLYQIGFLKNNDREMRLQLAPLLGTPDSGAALALFAQSHTEAYSGRLRSSLELSERGVEIARKVHFNELAAQGKIADALHQAEFGDPRRARQTATTSLTISSGRRAKLLTALALARAGDVARAQALADELESRFPSNTWMQRYWLPTIRASIELYRKNPARALLFLRDVSYELGDVSIVGDNLYPVYIRGQAYLGIHQGKEAAAEFQKFLDHSGIVSNSPLGAMARLGLARAFSLQDDKARALEAYQDFLAIWKDADPGLPILKAARAEYAKIQ
jgi:eukaryotic-like serine/threonine-protein kinase